MTIKYILFFQILLIYTLISLLIFGCGKRNIHENSLAAGIWRVEEIQVVDTALKDIFMNLPGTQIAFNACTKSMNNDWGTDHETYGECWMVLSGNIDNQFTQDEYRFHVRNEESVEIKRLNDHSDRILPDLTGPYTYIIDGRNMVLRYTGLDRPEFQNLEIHCWDWEP